jgi:hypothetical protein
MALHSQRNPMPGEQTAVFALYSTPETIGFVGLGVRPHALGTVNLAAVLIGGNDQIGGCRLNLRDAQIRTQWV